MKHKYRPIRLLGAINNIFHNVRIFISIYLCLIIFIYPLFAVFWHSKYVLLNGYSRVLY
jgi:hypothetical protein